MTTYIKFDVQVETYSIGGYDPEDSWSRDSTEGSCYVTGATIVEKDGYDTLGVEEDISSGDTIYLVWAEYTTGDSFGRDAGNYELLEVFTDAQAACDRVAYWENISDYSVPWIGHFESLDGVHVTTLEVQHSMNTENLVKAINEAQAEYKRNNSKDPTKLYLDNVHAMKLEWYMKVHCTHDRMNDGKVIFNGMRVFPVMVAEEHLQII